MIPKVRYTVTKASNDGTFTVGDQVWLLEDGSIMSRQMEGWIDRHEVPAATEGWQIEVDKNWRDTRLAKLRAEVAELEALQ